ncbi:hypothetical protein [Agrobacterium tumefaciens]|uniref:hypothetical protein n=1 Tax=Agrobacterium tumefaciens TaxID=358 RepID=UPI0021CFFD67|nr:hypothetical protein [Agrobacterium tumefaciens]UXT99445.1 hypothetical protein FY129_18340 [Agrobacterium tumefaciens]
MAKQPLNRKSYRYSGPITPLEADGTSRMLFPGTSYVDLPVENDIVKNLIERKLLIAETGDGEAAPADASAEGA